MKPITFDVVQYFIDVIVPIPIENLFTYRITRAESELLCPGVRVAVPFGKSKLYTAIVYGIHQNPPLRYEAKDIHQILDEEPIVTPKQLELWDWIASYYMCSVGEVMRAALPGAFLIESETLITLNEGVEIEESQLNDEEFLVYEALQHRSSIKADEVSQILETKAIIPVLKNMIDRGVIRLQEEVYERYKPKLVRYVRLSENYTDETTLSELLDTMGRAPKQRAVLLSYFSLSPSAEHIKVKELIVHSKASSPQIRALIDKGILEEYYLQTDRIKSKGGGEDQSKELNPIQNIAYAEIKASFEEEKVVLIHGVTSSGKTEIYVKLIESVLNSGKQVLYLVPEIALTSQLVRRLRKYFGDQIAVYHSRYSLNERVEVWHHVRHHDEKGKLILGARSAVLLPFSELGLVIIDEEHEPSYKQFDPAPRYHARDTALVLARLFGAQALMGSATPSLESYYNATIEQKYRLVELKERYNKVLMPEIELVDLKDKYRRKRMQGHFSDRMVEEIQLTLEEKMQVILFQNRRGFSPIVECNSCGHAPQCPNCDVSLTYHQFRDQLRCHYCGHAIPMIKTCLACGSVELDSKGFGTEQVETEIKHLFPEAKVARMDLDTTRGKHSYEKLISAFEQSEIDILVGTQMLTKGLDFRKVRLVGIMNADNLLNFPDFRAHERSFQLMQQVAGRAGRTDIRGKVIIQTFNPYHQILQQVASHDYEGMFREQLEERRIYKYPPINRLIRMTLRHKDFNLVNQGSDWMVKSLKLIPEIEVLGPEFPPVARIRNQYNKLILIKISAGVSLKAKKEAILKIKNSFLAVKSFRPVRVILNVDYY